MDTVEILGLVAIGIVAGAWNAIAGGATLFSFPALMAIGLSPVVANATNYVALLPANLAALPAYRDELRAVGRRLIPIVGVSGAGAAAGSLLLIVSDPTVFRMLIPALLLAATLLFALGGRLRTALVAVAGARNSTRYAYVLLFIVSIYGGYFGAGLGIILLAIAQIMGFGDYQTANAIKNLAATGFTLISILLFGIGGLIAWQAAAVMMVGSAAGGYAGARMTRHIPQGPLRVGVTLFGLVLTGVYALDVFGPAWFR